MLTKTSRKRHRLMLIMGLFIMLTIVLWYFRTNFFWDRGNIESVRQGIVTHEESVDVVFANTETTLTAPAEGMLTLPREEGRRFAKEEIVARIIPSGVDYGDNEGEVVVTAPHSGLFFSKYDNLEDIITPENLMAMDLNALLSQSEGKVFAGTQDSVVGKHSPIGKIVNNLYPTWMFVYLNGNNKMLKGETVKIIVDDYEYSGIVMKESQLPQGAIVRFGEYVKGSTEERVRQVTWIVKAPTRGLIIPSSAVIIQGEEKGVYITEEGLRRFRPVKVIDDNGNTACIQGLREGDRIISNPKSK